MPSRRTHQKSRLGCLQCKRRRVKCDEERPRCSSCVSRGALCEYATSGSLIWPKQSPPLLVTNHQGTTSRNFERALNSLAIFDHFLHSSSHSGAAAAAASAAASMPPPVPDARELELMVEWCTSTSLTVARNEATKRIWRDLVPKEALLHPFLMHGLLAVAALHLACCPDAERPVARPTESYLPVALSHQCQAIALFRPVLDDINVTNANASFAFAGLILTFAFGYPRMGPRRPPPPHNPLIPVDEMCRVFQLSRGIQDVLAATREWVMDGQFSHLLQLDGYTPFLPDGTRVALDHLRGLNAACGSQDPSRHETEVYVHTIDQIWLMLERHHGGCSRPSLAALFAIKVPERYLVLLQAHEPMALVVLAHFCVVLHGVASVWYLQGWGEHILTGIWMHLTPEWRPTIRWPMDITGTRMGDAT